MKKYKIIQNNNPEIASSNVAVYRGIYFPLSKSADRLIQETRIKVPIELTDNEVMLKTIPRRARIGDTVHIICVPKELLDTPNYKNLEGVVVKANGNNINVKLITPGLCAYKELELKRHYVTLLNVSDTHKVAYFTNSPFNK